MKVSTINERVRVGGMDEFEARAHNEGWDENVIRKMVLMEGSMISLDSLDSLDSLGSVTSLDSLDSLGSLGFLDSLGSLGSLDSLGA